MVFGGVRGHVCGPKLFRKFWYILCNLKVYLLQNEIWFIFKTSVYPFSEYGKTKASVQKDSGHLVHGKGMAHFSGLAAELRCFSSVPFCIGTEFMADCSPECCLGISFLWTQRDAVHA